MYYILHVTLGTWEQDAVEELATDPPGVIERLRPTLRDLKDLDPAIASLHHRRIQPSRLLSLLSTMRKVCGSGESGVWRCGVGSRVFVDFCEMDFTVDGRVPGGSRSQSHEHTPYRACRSVGA